MPPRLQRDAKAPERLRNLGQRIRDLRREAGRSQEAFAQDCGLHRTYVGAIERGEVNLSLLNLYRIADTLEVRIADLVA
jgi:transcriptional regulator with XRE-family HTH domain